MRQSQLADYRRLLQTARQETERALSDLEQGLGQELRESIVEFSTYDNHPADVASETYEREKDFALREAERSRLAEIDAAMSRVADGSFGRCVVCGQEIAAARLEAMPFAARCLRCQLEQEDPARERPIEESLENELLLRSFTDGDPRENVGFDGEDAWQAVARYGTSNGPGDFPDVTDYGDTLIDHDEPIGTVFDVESLGKSFEESREQFLPKGRRGR